MASWAASTLFATAVFLTSWAPRSTSAQVLAPATSTAIPTTTLEGAWNAILAQSPSMDHATVSAYAYDITTHTPLAAVHPDWRLTPASVNKLFTSVAALSTLGPTFRYTTQVRVSQSPDGPVYLVGLGDPWLEANGGRGLESIARTVAAHVRHATQVVGVSTLFGPTTLGTGWAWEDLPYSYAAPVSALTSARDEIHIVVTPAATAGVPPHVAVNPLNPSTIPAAPFLSVTNRAQTGAAGSPDTFLISHVPGTEHFILTGRLPIGTSAVDDYLTLAHPVLMTAVTFQRILAKDGVTFTRPATTGPLPSGTRTLLTHQSPPLKKYLQIQNTFSINSMAEALFHELGARAYGTGTSAYAQAALAHFLTSHDVASNSVHLDGSGLSPYDEVSAREAVELLTFAAGQPWFATFEHSLIHIGRTNQCSYLCGLMDHTAADGTVWLKTGNLNNQWNYVGYATAKNGNLVAFAILIDGLPTGRYYTAAVGPIDAMTVAVASYPNESARAGSGPSDSGTVSLPPLLKPIVGPFSPRDVVGGSLVSFPAHGGTPQTVWQANGGLRLEGGLLPRLGVALAASRFHPSVPGAEVLTQGTRSGTVLQGNLVLDGRWDPSLTAAGLAVLAQDVARSGIHSVTGRVVGVDGPIPTWYTEPWPPGIPWEFLNSGLTPPISPLSVGQGQVVLSVRGTGVATQAVQVLPAGAPVTAQVARLGRISSAIASGSGLTASWVRGTNRFVLSGSVAPGGPSEVTVSDPSPAEEAAALFRADLTRDGVVTHGVSLIRSAPSDTSVMGTLPAVSLPPVAVASLTDPSGYTSLDLYGVLGKNAARILAQDLGPVDYAPDPTGLGTENYLTANSITRLLANAAGVGADTSVLSALRQPWVVQTAEAETAVGVFGRRGRVYAYCVIVNGKKPPQAAVDQLNAGLDE